MLKSGLHTRFGSLAELATYAKEAPKTWYDDSSESLEARANWDLNAGYEGAVKLAQTGWIEGAQKLQHALKAFAPKTPTPAERFSVTGYRPSVPRYISGRPDCMVKRVTTQATHGRGKVLTLIVPISANFTTDARCMSHFGTAVAQYVRQLEMSGTRVELIGAMTTVIHGRRVCHSWTVKQAGQGLNLAEIAFSIGHPAMFRRLGFACIERSASAECGSYGRSVDAERADVPGAPHTAVILNGMVNANTHAPTAEAGLAYVEAQITEALAKQRF